MTKAKTVNEFLELETMWKDELTRLVEILRGCGLDEAIKWGVPVYAYKSKNVVGVSGFKTYFGLWFHQGALLTDANKVLINAQEGKTRGQRQWRMTSAKEIRPRWIQRLVGESKKVIDSGLEIKPLKNLPVDVPLLLAAALKNDRDAKKAFEALTRGCQREYVSYIDEAKQEATKLRRIDKILPMIREKIGLHDKYR